MSQYDMNNENSDFSEKKDQALFAMLKNKRIILFKEKRNNAKNRKIRKDREDLAFENLLVLIGRLFTHEWL